METTAEQARDTSVLHLSGRMTADRCDERLPARVRRLVSEGTRLLVLDLRSVSYMDSTCLGELIEACVTLRRHGGQLSLVNVPPHIQHLLDISRLTQILGDGRPAFTGRRAPGSAA